MKKIVPFNNVLDFNTDVKEITAISLEHEISKSPDMINGVFYISGEYKISEALLDTEKFNFELPFDIALSNTYKTDSLLVDFDDFRYSLISDKSLKVNIDLYIDGEVEEQSIELPEPRYVSEESKEFENRVDIDNMLEELIDKPLNTFVEESVVEEEVKEETPDSEIIEPERIDLLKEMLNEPKEEEMEENNINNNENMNLNVFDNDKEENYVTYRVYVVEENDNIDTILTKYKITKEELSNYNDIENIKCGDKLIIPTNEK